MLKRIFFLGFVVLFQLYAFGQSKQTLKQADKYYHDSSYYNAIINYEIYLGIRAVTVEFDPYSNNKKRKLVDFDDINSNKPGAVQVFYNLGQSYRMLNDYENAEKWYAKVLKAGSPNLPFARLWHAQCLRALGHYQNAEKELKKFIKDNDKEENREYILIANNELNNISFIRQQTETRKPPAYALHKLKGDFNQIEGAYAPVLIHDTTLLFTSARIVDTVNKASKVNSHVNHLFYNTINPNRDSVTGKAYMVRFPSRTAANEGTPTFSPDGNTLYFTRWEPINGNSNSAIYVSKKKNDSTWDEPTKLSDSINVKGYNSNQPFVTDDGKYLLYASDRPDGVGKYDIWAAPLDTAGKVGTPFNLKEINTREDDKAPFYHTNSKTLVFSSNGRIGMGGFDLYSATGDITSLQTPVNLGAPINSIKDDNYFFSASKDTLMKKVYVSSDRKSQCCLEIFSVERLPKKIFKQKIDGLLSDSATGKPISNATITVTNSYDSTKNKTVVTGTDGLFLLDMNDSTSKITFKRKGYDEKVQPFKYDPEIYTDTTFMIEVPLTKAKKIYHKQLLEGVVIDCETNKPISKVYITASNQFDSTKNIVVSSLKDGAFSIKLNDSINALWFEKKAYYDKDVRFKLPSDSLEADTTYKITYCMSQFKPEDAITNVEPINDPTKIDAVVKTINKSDSVTIHFDFNQTVLRPDAVETLNKMLSIMKTYPSISLELDITGHTDAIGSEAVNLRIGRERAIACLDYLISKGISQSRLNLKSYGKSNPVAPDFINHKDNPAGRAKNRRVVMKVKARVEEIIDKK